MTYLSFPHHFADRSIADGFPRLVGTVRTPGRSASGVVPATTISGGGLWTVQLSGIFLRTPADLRLWESLAVYLAEGARPIVVSVCLKKTGPFPVVDGAVQYRGPRTTHSDGAGFSDGTAYYQPSIVAEVQGNYDLRATEIRLRMLSGGPAVGLFSLRHDIGPRWYRIISSLPVEGVSDFYDVRIGPPLRADVMNLAPAEFDRPECVMQLAGGDAMMAPGEMLRFARGSAAFVESFLPEPA